MYTFGSVSAVPLAVFSGYTATTFGGLVAVSSKFIFVSMT